jgi:phage baseplate assembly protein W
MAFDFSDFYIEYPGHPRFNDTQIIEDDVIRVIIQKWEMILFTNKGELFCEPNFGGDLPRYLYETKLSAETIEGELRGQISDYINELESITYTLKVSFYDDPERYQEWMEVYFQVADYDVYANIA